MEEKYHNSVVVAEFMDQLYGIDGLGPVGSHNLELVPYDVPLDATINWGIYLDLDYADTEVEKQYVSMWLHNYFMRDLIKNEHHHKETCSQCRDTYNNFINAIIWYINNDFISYCLEYIAKWMIFNDYRNNDLMKFIRDHSHHNDIVYMAYYILYWGENPKDFPNLYHILNKYCAQVKEFICRSDLVGDYINFRISGHEGDGELNDLKVEFTQEFYKNLPRDYQLGVML